MRIIEIFGGGEEDEDGNSFDYLLSDEEIDRQFAEMEAEKALAEAEKGDSSEATRDDAKGPKETDSP